MPFLPELAENYAQTMNTTTFLGLNRNLATQDGEISAMRNLSSGAYPLLAPRCKRAVMQQDGGDLVLRNPQGMMAKDQLAWVDDGTLYYGGVPVDGLNLAKEGKKQMVSMGAFLCIWPDKVWYNPVSGEYGSMEADYRTEGRTEIKLDLCRNDGSIYSTYTTASKSPTGPANGDYWLDTSQSPHMLNQWNEYTGQWVGVPTLYVRISGLGVGANFKQYDAVKIEGLSSSKPAIQEQLDLINGHDMVLYQCADDFIVVAAILDEAVTIDAITANRDYRMHRRVPDCDFICESNNRLWGCRYDTSSGEVINEIYATKLGDMTNWYCYMGLSTDSYAVTVGTDGRFTGCVNMAGVPHFFKDQCVHKISGMMPSQYNMVTTTMRGVQQGSEASMLVVDEVLYYKSRTGVMAYDGSLPQSISEKLGGDMHWNAVAGSWGSRYWISMEDGLKKWHLLCYDTRYGLWHEEDDLQVLAFANLGESLYALCADGRILDLNGVNGKPEDIVTWSVTFGTYGYEYPEQKYLSRFNLRIKMNKGDRVRMWIQYDSDGEWHYQGEMEGKATQTFMIPVIPCRCDHCQLKLEGRGDVRIFGIARLLETGGDG